MADPQYTLEEFGQRIKAKYPQYANLSDTDIANKVLAKYPQYRASIKPPSTPSQPTAVLRAPTQRERFLNPNFYPVGQKGEGLGENLKNIAQRGGVGIFQLADAMTHPVDTLEGIAASVTPQELLDYGSTHGREGELRRKLASGGTLTPEEQQYLDKATRFENAQSPAQALTEAVTTSRGPMELAGKAAPLAGQVIITEGLGDIAPEVVSDTKAAIKGPKVKALETLRSKYGPRSVSVGDESIPVTVGEAEPESAAGRTQKQLKRSGAGSREFERVEKTQQEAAKNVIKSTAQKASGFIGPMHEEAGGVLDDAATASFRQAEPLYKELDNSLRAVPGSLENVSKIVQDAIGRAKKLGVNIDEAAGDISKIRPDKNGAIQWGGSKISKTTHPERWQKLVDEGIIDDSGEATPLKTYRAVRSQLSAMQRSATNDATRFAIGNEIQAMDANIDAALNGTPLEGKFQEANRLWRQGKARIEVANAVKAATKGTPASVQAEGLSKVPTEIQGSNLVKRLNDLEDDGTLAAAYTPDEIRNLRQSAEILDRIQSTPVGKGAGESMSFARGLTHAVRGYKGPVTGAIIGGTAELLSGGSLLRGMEMGAGIGFIVQAIGERALVNVMTKLDGVKALEAVENAKTPAEMTKALTALVVVANASPQGPKAQQLQRLADEQRQNPPQ